MSRSGSPTEEERGKQLTDACDNWHVEFLCDEPCHHVRAEVSGDEVDERMYSADSHACHAVYHKLLT